MALFWQITDTWSSADQFEAEAFLLDKSLLENEDGKFVNDWLRVSSVLRQLASLEDNWDGDGASPPDETIIESVSYWFNSLRLDETEAPTRLVADPDGAVVVEWLEAERYFEVEFSSPYKGEWMVRYGDEPAQYGEIDLLPQVMCTEDTISGNEVRPIRHDINDTTWSSSEYQNVYAASA